MAFRAHCYKNVADRAFPSEKINILRGAFLATGIDWNRNQQKMLKVFMTQQPQAKYRHDYRAPDYLISDIDLTFDLDAAKTVVTALSNVSRQSVSAAPLRTDGGDLTLISLHINDQPRTNYKKRAVSW